VLATVGILIGAQHPAAQDKVTCNMAWPPQGSSIGIMVAEERRFFKEASLDVNSSAATAETARRRSWITGCSFGHVDSISMLLNCKNGGKIRFIGATNTRSPAAIYYIKEGHQHEILHFLR